MCFCQNDIICNFSLFRISGWSRGWGPWMSGYHFRVKLFPKKSEKENDFVGQKMPKFIEVILTFSINFSPRIKPVVPFAEKKAVHPLSLMWVRTRFNFRLEKT